MTFNATILRVLIPALLAWSGTFPAHSAPHDGSSGFAVSWLPARFENPKGDGYDPRYETIVTAYRKGGGIRVHVISTDGRQLVDFDVPAAATAPDLLAFRFANDGAFNSGKGTLKKTKSGAVIDVQLVRQNPKMTMAGMWVRLYPQQQELKQVKFKP